MPNPRLRPTPAREVIAPEVHRRSSLPRFATITARRAEPSGDAPRGQAGDGLSRQPLGGTNGEINKHNKELRYG